jgi:hypothetical protein
MYPFTGFADFKFWEIITVDPDGDGFFDVFFTGSSLLRDSYYFKGARVSSPLYSEMRNVANLLHWRPLSLIRCLF